jgi:hypothetical protein
LAALIALAAAVLALSEFDEGNSRASVTRIHGAGSSRTEDRATLRSIAWTTTPTAQAWLSPASSLTVPGSFLGVSSEYWAFSQYASEMPLFARVMSLLHVRGTGSMILRIGGDSADLSLWNPRLRGSTPWLFTLTPAWLSEARWLVEKLHVRLIVDLNLVTSSPLQAAAWAHEVATYLPRGSIAGFEIGNEPDLFSRRFWIETVSPTAVMAAFVPSNLAPLTYTHDYRSYARALARVAPGIPLVAPAVANSVLDARWIARLLANPHPLLGTVSGHWYPYSGCARRRAATFPTIARVLSENATAGMARGARRIVRLAAAHGLPFRLTEFNSITCGGRPGVSDTFATALWAPDALFELLQAGVSGVNVHIRAHTINAPFILNRDGLDARPFLYGLLLFSRTLGADARLLPVDLRASRTLHVKVWAVRVAGDTLHVLLIDKGPSADRVELRLPASGPASVERLLAPGAGARSGVTLAGRHLNRAGRWIGRRVEETVRPGTSGYAVTLPRFSAALLSVPIREPRTVATARAVWGTPPGRSRGAEQELGRPAGQGVHRWATGVPYTAPLRAAPSRT